MRHFHVRVADGSRTQGALTLTREAADQEAEVERFVKGRKAEVEACELPCYAEAAPNSEPPRR